MGFLMPKVPAMPALPPPPAPLPAAPSYQDEDRAAAVAAKRAKIRSARTGRSSTILTSATGLADEDELIYRIVQDSFSQFIEYHILPYKNSQMMPISFVGSIAYHFQDILMIMAEKYNISIGKIIQKPINKIVDYHINF